MRLVHPVETLKNMRLVFLRNPDSRVFHLDIEIFMVCIERYMDPAIIVIIFDRILHKIRYSERKFHLVDLCTYRTETLHDHLHIFFVCDRTETLQDLFQELIDIDSLYIQILSGLVHLNERKKVCDDLILPVDLFCDILHELLIHLHRSFLHLKKRIRQHFHRCHRRLQFVRDI